MARGFTTAFAGDEAVVTPSASCAAMIREYYPALAAQARDPGLAGMPSFPVAAKAAAADSQLRANLAHATHTIRAKRAGAVAELADWEQLRQAAKAIKDHTLAHLDTYLLRLEANVTRAGPAGGVKSSIMKSPPGRAWG